MADITHAEAGESEGEEEELNEVKKAKSMEESEEEDLVLQFGDDSNDSTDSKKRKRSDDENYPNHMEEDILKFVEADLEAKIENKRFKCDFTTAEETENKGEQKIQIKVEPESEDQMESQVIKKETDAGTIDEDDEMKPMKEKATKKNVFTDEALLKVQNIFGVNFDNEIFGKYGREEYQEDRNEIEQLKDYKSDEKSRNLNKQTKKSIRKFVYDIYEPNLLRRVHSVNLDNEICTTDIPERMQLRLLPVKPVAEGSNELDLEAKWIYEQAFCKQTVSIQDMHLSEVEKERLKDKINNRYQTIGKIKMALDFMRNQHFEVPFISCYRKEFVYPELDINDLWKVYKFDAKWCQLRQRKKHLLRLFENMRNYQLDEIVKYVDTSLPASLRVIKDEDIERLKNAETSEEVHDIYRYFKLHYSHKVQEMMTSMRRKEREAQKEERKKSIEEAEENREKPPEDMGDEEDQELDEPLEPQRNDPYSICRKAGLDLFIKKFGLSSEEFAENLCDNYQRHEVEQESFDPMITASKFCGKKFSAPEKILKSAQFMFAIQLACEPLIRKTLRSVYMEKAKLSVRATKKGVKEIDENHPIFSMKYLKNKPVKDLVGDQFLKLVIAEQDELITITFSDIIEGNTTNNYVEEVKKFFFKYEFSRTIKDWNSLRIGSVEMALTKMVILDMKKELRANLLFEAKDCVMRECCQKIHNWIKVAPYICQFPRAEDEEWDISKGIRVMGLAFLSDEAQASYACIVAPNGECTDFLKLPHLLKRRNSLKESEKLLKETELLSIRNFIAMKKPHVVSIGGESRDALMIQSEIREIVASLVEEEKFPTIQVEICDNDLAKIYVNSNRAIFEFRDYSLQLRQAISLGRRLQDPLIEFSQLCNSDDEILNLKYHSLQDQLPQDELLENIHTEFINRVNEVGVNVNKVAQKSYSDNLLQFVCGLGPRKAQALIKILKKQVVQKLENRAQLVTICNMGPKVFINCAGFIKIDTNSLGDNADAYVEILDGSRIHPESYEWAKKMAVDALEEEGANPARALEEILRAPEKLKDLDLDAFAEQLEKQGLGNKIITLYGIYAELSCMYKDLRTPYESPSSEQLFNIITKETPETFYTGKLIVAKVVGISYKKPQGEQLDNVKPMRNDETGFWQCPFCFKNDFLELSEVWTHFETSCPGRATGVKLRLDNGVSGYIHIKNLSDKNVTNPKERVCINQPIHCRITKIDVEKFGVECTSRSKDLADRDNEWRAPKDPFYDREGEERERRQEEEAKKSKLRQAYIKRIIGHPCFKNIDFADAEKLMRDRRPGEVIIRPSSKGPNHLTVTWKIADEVIQHIDVIEEGKANDFVLGAKLRIGNEEFEDLDDIIMKHINPMSGYISEILNFKYYKPHVGGSKERAEDILKIQKRENPSGIPYIISAARQYPGNFLLSYLPRTQCRHEYFSVIPEGFKFRIQMFVRLNDLIRWFKEHFKEPIPTQIIPSASRGVPPSSSSYQSTSNPGVRSDELREAIQKVAHLPYRQYACESIYQSNQTIYQSQVTGSVAGYNGKNSYSQTLYSPHEKTSLSNIAPYQSPQMSFVQPTAPQQQSSQQSSANTPKTTENNMNKPGLTWNEQLVSKVFDDTYFTKSKKPKIPYDNGVGHGLKLKLARGKYNHRYSKSQKDQNSFVEPAFKSNDFGSSRDSFDNNPFTARTSRESSRSRDNFDDNPFARGSSRDNSFDKFSTHGSSPKHNGDFNPFTVGSSRNNSSPPRNSFKGAFRGRGKLNCFNKGRGMKRESSYHSSPPREVRYSRSPSRERSLRYTPSPFRERSPIYHSSRSRERSPRFNSRSSWDRSPPYRSNHSRERSPRFTSNHSRDISPRFNSGHLRDRSPGFQNSRSSWDRSPGYRSSPPRGRSPTFDPRFRNRSPGLKNSRSSWDRSPVYRSSPPRDRSPSFNPGPSRDRSPQFESASSREKVPKFKPRSPPGDPAPDEENPFIKGSARDVHRDDDSRESSPEVPKKIYPFNRGRGRGFRFTSGRFRGRGSRYDIVSPRDSMMVPPPFNGSKPVFSETSMASSQENKPMDDNPFLIGSSRDPTSRDED